jgi:hypothetical protein
LGLRQAICAKGKASKGLLEALHSVTWSDSSFAAHPWPPIRVVLGQDDRIVGHAFRELVDR